MWRDFAAAVSPTLLAAGQNSANKAERPTSSASNQLESTHRPGSHALLVARSAMNGTSALSKRSPTTFSGLCRPCLLALATAAICVSANLAALADDRALLDDVLIRSAALDSPSFDSDSPLLFADAGSRLRNSPEAIGCYKSQFADKTRLELLQEMPLPDFSELLKLSGAKAPLHVELPPEDFKELDEGRPRLTTASLDANEQRSVVGGRLLVTTPLEARGKLHSEARLLWLSEFLQAPGANTTAFFAPGDSAIFATQGLSYGSNWAMLGGRFRWELIGGLSAFAGYDNQFNSQQIFHIGSTGLNYAW